MILGLQLNRIFHDGSFSSALNVYRTTTFVSFPRLSIFKIGNLWFTKSEEKKETTDNFLFLNFPFFLKEQMM